MCPRVCSGLGWTDKESATRSGERLEAAFVCGEQGDVDALKDAALGMAGHVAVDSIRDEEPVAVMKKIRHFLYIYFFFSLFVFSSTLLFSSFGCCAHFVNIRIM